MDAKTEQLEYMKVNELKRISRQLAEINKTLKHGFDTSRPPYYQIKRSDQTDYTGSSVTINTAITETYEGESL